MAAAQDMDVARSPLVQAIFKAREIAVGALSEPRKSRGLVEETLALGWGVLAEVPGREIVIGAVTKPWEGNGGRSFRERAAAGLGLSIAKRLVDVHERNDRHRLPADGGPTVTVQLPTEQESE